MTDIAARASTEGEGEGTEISGGESGSASGERTTVFDSERGKAAAAKSAEVRAAKAEERRRQRLEGTRPSNDVRRTVREALGEIPEADLKAYIRKAVLEGRDVRAITTLLDRAYAGEAQSVDEPHTLDAVRSLTPEERRTLWDQLEAQGRTHPLASD